MTTDQSQAEILPETAPRGDTGATFAARIVRLVDGLAARIEYVMESRPLATRIAISAFMVIAIMFGIGRRARAGMLQDEVQTAFNISDSFNLFQNSINLAMYIFATLAALTVIVRVLAYYIKHQSVRGLGQVVLSSVLSLGIPFVIIQIAPVVLPAVSMIGLEVTDIITGNPISSLSDGIATTPDPTTLTSTMTTLYNNTFGRGPAGIPELTPKAIVDKGVNVAWPLVQQVALATKQAAAAQPNPPPGTVFSQPAYDSNQMVVWFVTMLAIATIGAFVFIAVELVIAYLQIYLVLPIAAFSLGFLGSPATRHFGAGYWTLVVQALIRFSTIIFVIGFAMSVSTFWVNDISLIQIKPLGPGTVDLGIMKAAISAAAVSFSLLYIVRVLPSMFAAVLSGMTVGAEGNNAESMLQSSAAQGGRPMPGGKGPGGPKNPPTSLGRVPVPTHVGATTARKFPGT